MKMEYIWDILVFLLGFFMGTMAANLKGGEGDG